MTKKIIHTLKAPSPVGPYSQAILTQGTLYVSGQVPLEPESGQVIAGDIVAQTNQVMKNLQAILVEARMDFSNVVKCSIFLTDLDNFEAVNEIFGQYFPADPPARETVEVSRLPKEVDVEISCVAISQNDRGLAKHAPAHFAYYC